MQGAVKEPEQSPGNGSPRWGSAVHLSGGSAHICELPTCPHGGGWWVVAAFETVGLHSLAQKWAPDRSWAGWIYGPRT